MRSPKEVGRRLYSDLVTRRATVTVVPAQDDGHDREAPIFIIGVYRSGTTLLRYIVDSHSRICCPPESDFLLPLLSVLDDDRALPSLNNLGYDDDHVTQRIRLFASYFFQNYAAAVGKPRWADKTPSYIDCLDNLLRVFPNAQFVFIYRNGLSQSHSMTRGGTYKRPVLEPHCRAGEDLRLGAMRYWSQQVCKMAKFEQDNPQQVTSIRYEDLCDDPNTTMQAVFRFLGEEFEKDAISYGSFEHTKGKEDGVAGANDSILPAEDHSIGWDTSLRDQCISIGSEALAATGYRVEADRAIS